MNIRWIHAGIAVSMVMAMTCAARAAPPPVEAFGRKPAMTSVDLNPSGNRIAFIEDDGVSARVVIHDLAASKVLRNIRVPEKVKLWRVRWADEDTVLIDQSITTSVNLDQRFTEEFERWVAIDATSGPERVLLMREGTRAFVSAVGMVRARTTRPGKVFMMAPDWSAARHGEQTGSRLVGGRKDSGWALNAYEVDLASGNGRQIGSGSPFTTGWLVDDSGDLLVRRDFDPKDEQFTVLARSGLSWRTLYSSKGCEPLGLVAFSADRKAVIAQGRACGEEREKLWSLPLDGSPASALYAHAELDVQGTYVDTVDGTLLGVALGGAEQPSHWLDEGTGRRLAGLRKSFGARQVSIVSRSSNGQRIVARVADEAHPRTYYLVDYAAGKADILSEAYPLLAGVALGAVREFRYPARDQYALLAYLTLPPGSDGRNLPLVVMPHGGPESRDDLDFDWVTQFLASRGYAVLQPQFRGSSGFGQAHADAGRRQWGLRMQDDVTDAVKAAVAQGIANPGRVCIVGASYGGYAALAGAAFTPELYACAVSIGGVADLPAMIGFSIKNWGRESNSVAYWREHIGPPGDPQVIAKSPERAVSAVRAPILLIHGTDDVVVPVEQSRSMARALRDAGKTVDLVEIEGEDHWLMTTSASRIRMLTEIEKFLGRHLGSQAPPSGAAN